MVYEDLCRTEACGIPYGRGFKLFSDSYTYISDENGSLTLNDKQLVITRLMQEKY